MLKMNIIETLSKNGKIYLFITILFLISSCNSDKPKTIYDYLINGSWRLLETETFYYHDDVFNRSEIKIHESEEKQITDFERNNIMYVEHPAIIDRVVGNWGIDSKGEILHTDIYIQASASSGYGKLFLFSPSSKIIELNENTMILESTPKTYYFGGVNTPFTKVMEYSKDTYIKN